MQEVTRIITLEITVIGKGEAEKLICKEEAKKTMQEDIKEYLNVDDVVITNIQDFVRDIET